MADEPTTYQRADLQTSDGAAGQMVTIDCYLHVETPHERLTRFANRIADEAARLMALGAPEHLFNPLAEAADELARMADFVDPLPETSFAYWVYPAGNAAEPG